MTMNYMHANIVNVEKFNNDTGFPLDPNLFAIRPIPLHIGYVMSSLQPLTEKQEKRKKRKRDTEKRKRKRKRRKKQEIKRK